MAAPSSVGTRVQAREMPQRVVPSYRRPKQKLPASPQVYGKEQPWFNRDGTLKVRGRGTKLNGTKLLSQGAHRFARLPPVLMANLLAEAGDSSVSKGARLSDFRRLCGHVLNSNAAGVPEWGVSDVLT